MVTTRSQRKAGSLHPSVRQIRLRANGEIVGDPGPVPIGPGPREIVRDPGPIPIGPGSEIVAHPNVVPHGVPTNDEPEPMEEDFIQNTNNTSTEMVATGVDAQTQTTETGNQGGFQINPIVPHKPDSNPFTETRTVRHLWEGYFACIKIDDTPALSTTDPSGNKFGLTLNHVYQPVVATLRNTGTTLTKGLSNKQAPQEGGVTSYADCVDFPRKCHGADAVDKNLGVMDFNRPTWVTWYNKLYRFWAPIETKYKVTIGFNNYQGSSTSSSALANRNCVVYIGVYPQSYVASNTSDIRPLTTNVPTTTTGNGAPQPKNLTKKGFEKFKGMKWYKISSNRYNGEIDDTIVTITGLWKPGMQIGSVRNLTDIKQWYPTGTEPSPLWQEQHQFVLMTSEFNNANPVQNVSVNCHVELEYIIQYKDLKDAVKYVSQPTPGNEAIHLRPGIDDIQYPYPISNDIASGRYEPNVPTYA